MLVIQRPVPGGEGIVIIEICLFVSNISDP